jgi:micrococcal nuclease
VTRYPVAVLAAILCVAPALAQVQAPVTSGRPAVANPAQPRPHGTRITVNPTQVAIDDGDTVVIDWGNKDLETVRILGIDCPETRHPEHDLPYAQSFGDEARAFARGAFSGPTRIELLRASMLDPFGRTLGYLFVNGRNYSTLIVQARLAEESVSQYGDNGLPVEAAEVLGSARTQGPLPFERPAAFRGRMRELSKWLKARGEYPKQ